MRASALLVVILVLAACQEEEEEEEVTLAEPRPAAETPEPAPPPEPEPELPECPPDTWAVVANGRPVAAGGGVEAANLVRNGVRGDGWSRVSVCRHVTEGGEHDVHMVCSPARGNGAECSIGFRERVCTGMLPRPMLPIAAGQLVDTSALPEQGEWSCHAR